MIVTRVCPKKRRVKQQGFNITIGFITVVTFGKQRASPLQLQACICVELLGLFRCCCRFPPQRKVLQPRFPLFPLFKLGIDGELSNTGCRGSQGGARAENSNNNNPTPRIQLSVRSFVCPYFLHASYIVVLMGHTA